MLNEILILIAFIGGYFLCFFTNRSVEFLTQDEKLEEIKKKEQVKKMQTDMKKMKGDFVIEEEEEEKEEELLDIDDTIRYNKEKEHAEL